MKLLISVSANVLNQDVLTNYIKALHTGQTNVDRWLDKTVRTYLLNEDSYHSRVAKLPASVPEWALKAKDLVEFKATPKLTQDLEHAIGWLRTFPDTKVFNVAVEDAITQGNLHIERENKKADSKEGILEVLHTFKDGWTIVSLKDTQSLKREGKIMQHCVGSEQQDYIKGVANKTLQIWSLRDTQNQPHCTIEYFVKTKTIEQIKGKQNLGIIKKYQAYIITWLKLAMSKRLVHEIDKSELLNVGILLSGDVWYDLHHLPDGFTYTGDLHSDDLGITVLPNNMTVNGALTVGQDSLLSLPDGLTVNSLRLAGYKGQIPVSTRVLSVLSINSMDNLVIHPNLLSADANATFQSITNLKLPADLKVAELQLIDCSIKELPTNLSVQKLILNECTQLTTIPKGTNVSDLFVQQCPTLISVDCDLQLDNHLSISGCVVLEKLAKINAKSVTMTKLPNLLAIGEIKSASSISITQLPKLTTLGKIEAVTLVKLFDLPKLTTLDTITSKTVKFVNCASLTSLSDLNCDQLRVEQCDVFADIHPNYNKILVIDSCPAFEVLRGTYFKELTIDSCGLTTVQPSLHVEDVCNLTNNLKLKTLPSGFTVNGSLKLAGCSELLELPNDLKVRDVLILTDCVNITSIPKGLKVFRLHLDASGVHALPADIKVNNIVMLQSDFTGAIPEGYAASVKGRFLYIEKVSTRHSVRAVKTSTSF